MIIIKCCANCKYYDDEQCTYCESVGVTPDDWCPAWEETETIDKGVSK